jgi:hypothetical protein
MRKTLLTSAAALMLTATAAMAQHGPPAGAGPGGGMGAGPPISPPGLAGMGQGTSDLAHDIASQRGQFGRDFAAQQRDTHMNAAQLQAMAAQHRSDAMALAQAARSGARIPANAGPRIKTALRFDIDAWREQFQVDRKSWQTMRDAWLAERPNMTARDWAQRRADWFAARDAWIANQRTMAMARRR